MRSAHTRDVEGRRGVVLPLVVVGIFMLMAFTTLAIDGGYLYMVKSELQRSADNGALGGAIEYSDESIVFGNGTLTEKLLRVRSRAKAYVSQNPAGKVDLALEDAQITMGYLSDPYDPTELIDSMADPATWNVLQVTTRRTADSPNGAVGLFFARVFGRYHSDVTATSTAVLDDRFSGLVVPDERRSPMLPFGIREDDWIDEVVNKNGQDLFGLDENGNVTSGSDGMHEIKLYPVQLGPSQNPNNDPTAAGNFGTLNIGVSSDSGSALIDQIFNGITGEQINAEFGTNELGLWTPDGGTMSNDISGNPGITDGMKEEVASRLGEVVGFFIYDTLTPMETGTNAIFHVVGIQFARIMEVDLTGNDKRIILQPAAYVSDFVKTSEDKPSTGGLVANLSLIR